MTSASFISTSIYVVWLCMSTTMESEPMSRTYVLTWLDISLVLTQVSIIFSDVVTRAVLQPASARTVGGLASVPVDTDALISLSGPTAIVCAANGCVLMPVVIVVVGTMLWPSSAWLIASKSESARKSFIGLI